MTTSVPVACHEIFTPGRVLVRRIWTQGRIRRVAHQIDQRLLNMILIDLQHHDPPSGLL